MSDQVVYNNPRGGATPESNNNMVWIVIAAFANLHSPAYHLIVIISLVRKHLPLFIIFLLAFGLRVIFPLQNSISFHYDMARDAFAAQEIWRDHHLKIQGPPTSTPGIYHGVLYYYLLAPFYGLGRGNPQFPVVFLCFLNSLTLIPLYILSLKILKQTQWAILSCLLFAFSYEAVQYASWLSNPAPAIFTTAFYFLGLKLWQEKHSLGLPLAVFSAALSIQFQFFLIYLLFLLPVFWYLFKPSIIFKQLFLSIGLLVFGLSTMIISVIKFGTFRQIISGLYFIANSHQNTSDIHFLDLVVSYVNHLANLFTNNLFPLNLFIGGLLGLAIFWAARKNKYILFSLFSSLPIFILGSHTSNYANLGLIVPMILATTLFIQKIRHPNIIFIFLIINLFSIIKIIPKGQVSLVIPQDMLLSRQLQIIDKTYALANGQPFTFNSLTLPLWTNTTWTYLYSWYGQSKYGYLPKFTGRDQTGMPGDRALEPATKSLPISFYIIEPDIGIPEGFFLSEIQAENSQTKLLQEFTYRDLLLHLRTPITN